MISIVLKMDHNGIFIREVQCSYFVCKKRTYFIIQKTITYGNYKKTKRANIGT
ncbi:hypothetical protein Palpr_0155 [Paludibacter propionicigenes WB4]|uniref:Uncharacterized protein n=1 Tax=Paludibacter propionicigenes (strain DSM 17365 / JCM 13257 / WB4) TaxID=694427 RepID=E4T0F8_PALPW|nr:hypothetical protein Palpr_0155 [Paludibacter propionicigenes WB4]